MSDPKQEKRPRERLSAAPEHWTSPEVVLLLTLLGFSIAIVPSRGLPWYWALLLICAVTAVEIVLVTRLSPILRSLTGRLVSLPLPLLIFVGAALGIVVVWQLSSSSTGASVPPPGAVVDAQTGQVLPPQRAVRPDTVTPGSQIAGGNIFRACNLPAEPDCPYNEDEKAIYARRGDRIRFKLRLHEPAGASIAFLKLSAGAASAAGSLKPRVQLEWTTAKDSEQSFDSIGDDAVIRTPAPGEHSLTYLAGSSALTDAYGDRLTRLPDGIMGGYILLKNVGSPDGCWDCDLDYIRFVEFSARVS